MSSLTVDPRALVDAAGSLGQIKQGLDEVRGAVSGPTVGVATAAADEVSQAISALFSAFGQEFQDIAARLNAWLYGFSQLIFYAGQGYIQQEISNIGEITWIPSDQPGFPPTIGSIR